MGSEGSLARHEESVGRYDVFDIETIAERYAAASGQFAIEFEINVVGQG